MADMLNFTDGWNTASGQTRVVLNSNMTAWPGMNQVAMHDLGGGVWSFDFAVQGITEDEADDLAERLTLLLCGGGRVRHTWLGRRLLGCKRMVAGAWKPQKVADANE